MCVVHAMACEWSGCRRKCALACACDVVVDAMWWTIQGCTQGHRPCQGGCLCVTRGCDAGVQKCAWCTPWHVSGGDVVECVLACACDAELAVVGHAGLYTGPQAMSGGLAVCHS